MLYPNLKFPKIKNRPFFYTNFVQTLDGKVAVKKPGYWPIGSKTDYQILLELRAHADCLIQGGNLSREFGEIISKSLTKKSFKSLRKKLKKDPNLPYYVISRHISVTHRMWSTTSQTPKALARTLYKKGYKNVLVEGGPTLLGSFLKENLIDEIFITIAPKILGTKEGTTLTLVEGILFPINSTKKLRLISVKPIKDELFLRYSVEN